MQELTVKQKLTNYYYFVAINSILLAFLEIGYFINNPDPIRGYLAVPSNNDWSAITFLITSHFCYVVLYLLICSIFLLPTLWITPKKRIFIQTFIVIFILLMAMADVLMFYMFGINITDTAISIFYNAVTSELFIDKLFTSRKITLYIGFILFCLFEYFLCVWVTNKNWLEKQNFGNKYFNLVIACLFTSSTIYFTSDKSHKQNLIAFSQHLPWVIIGDKKIINKIDNINKQLVLTKFTNFISNNNKKLNYPTKSLITKDVTNPPNILIIALDGWRADCFNAEDSPNLWQFAQKGKIFYNHKSAANGTFGGIFSLFYAVPASYWHSFLENKRIPVLFDRLQQLDYQISIITSAGTPLPLFIKNKNLSVNANLIYHTASNLNDKTATEKLLDWHNKINKTKPWFAFIFYNSAHDHNFPEDYSKDYRPVNNSIMRYHEIVKQFGKDYFINTYKLGVHYADHLAGKILTQLKEINDLKNTIVIITSDHGKEFNDTQQNQWGHGSNFTDYQMKIPFAIIGPNFKANELNWQSTDLTTNYDVIPTLMQNFLGVTNDTNDYSIGVNLLEDRVNRDWMLATGFGLYSFQCSIINNSSSMRWVPSGRYWFTDNMNRYLTNQIIDNKILNQALEYVTRFIKK